MNIDIEKLFRTESSKILIIEKTIAWYLENEQWWRSVMDGSYKNWIEKNYV